MRPLLKLAVCSLACASAVGHAAYQQLTPPPGWTAGGGAIVAGSGGSYAATTANAWIANASKSSAMLNVGGKQIAIPVSMKLAPAAGRVAAAALFLSPQLRLASSVASWLTISGVVWDAANNQWSKSAADAVPSTGFDYYISPNYMFSNPTAVCKHWISFAYPEVTVVSQTVTQSSCSYKVTQPGWDPYDINLGVQKTPSSCPAGWFVTSAGCVKNAPPAIFLTQQEMVDLLNPDNTPGWPSPTVPGEFPNIPFPIEIPVINPDTGVNPFPKPLFVPTGNPVLNPRYDPSKPQDATNQPFKQPGVRVVPSPTVGNPWQVDVQPVDKLVPTSEPNPNPESEPGQGDNLPEQKEIETCGLPGTPACKIDETGTPEPKENKSKADTDQAIKPLDDFLKDPTAALPQLPTINWAFTLPSGCAPIALPAFDPWLQEIDVCRFQPMFHDIMGFVWVMGGIFGAIGIFWRNTFSQG